MSVSEDPEQVPEAGYSFRFRAEGATLLGMALAIFSLFFSWERTAADARISFPGAIYSGTAGENAVRTLGLHTAAHWPLTVAAVGCGLTLLGEVHGARRTPLLFAHGLCAALCFGIALHWLALANFALLPGIALALLAGLLLLYGALERFNSVREK